MLVVNYLEAFWVIQEIFFSVQKILSFKRHVIICMRSENQLVFESNITSSYLKFQSDLSSLRGIEALIDHMIYFQHMMILS